MSYFGSRAIGLSLVAERSSSSRPDRAVKETRSFPGLPVRARPDAPRAPAVEDPGMRFSSRIENGRVLCGEKGVWTDIEECYHCPAFRTIKESGSAQTLVCKTA